MILPYSALPNLLLLSRGVGRKILFMASPEEEYVVTTEAYAKCLMCNPFLVKVLGRNLAEVKRYLDGGDSAILDSWVYQDIAKCLLNLKECAISGKVLYKKPPVILVNRDYIDEKFTQELAERNVSLLQALDGGKAPSLMFFSSLGTFTWSRIQNDRTLLDDNILSLAFIYMEKGGCENAHTT